MALNKDTFNRLYHEVFGGSYETFSQIVNMFAQDTPKSISEMREKYAQGDIKSIVHISHTLKSNGASLGADKFSQICAEIEAAGRAGAIPEFEKWSSELEAEFQVCSEEILEEVQASAA